MSENYKLFSKHYLFPKYKRLVYDSYLRKIGICVSEIRVVSYLDSLVVYRRHKSALARAQKCPYLGTKVPFLRHFSTLARQEYLLGVLFSDFLIIENVCIGFYIKIAVVDVWKNLYSREKLKSKYDFTLHPSSFRPEC